MTRYFLPVARISKPWPQRRQPLFSSKPGIMYKAKCTYFLNLILVLAIGFSGLPRTILEDINRDSIIDLKDAILYVRGIADMDAADGLPTDYAHTAPANILQIIAGIESHPSVNADAGALAGNGAKLYSPTVCMLDHAGYIQSSFTDMIVMFHSYIPPIDHRPPRC